jgi:hypothetical protein
MRGFNILMNIEKIIADFESLAYNVFAEDDFSKKNKIETKIDALVDKVYEQGVEQIFYDRLFNSTNLLARIEIAFVSSNRNYDLYKSLEVLKSIKKDAYSLTFFEDNQKNKKWQDYFANLSNVQLRGKIAFLEDTNDEFLFKKYYDCIYLFGQYYDSYILSKLVLMQEIKEKILSLLEGVKAEGKLNQFFEILFKQAKKEKSLLNLILINYFSWLEKYNPDQAEKNLKQILKNKQLNPKMLTFVKERLSEMTA